MPEPVDGGPSGLQNPAGGENGCYSEVGLSGVGALVASKRNLGSLNVRGGLKLVCSDKLQGLIARSKALKIGVLALQECKIAGVKRRLVQDFDGEPWGFCSAGVETANDLGTGFLVDPTLEIVSFKAFSPRVSLLEVRTRGKPCLETPNFRSVFISAYAPTEVGGQLTADQRASELQSFYVSLHEAVSEGKNRCNGVLPTVCGDFNVSLVLDTRASQEFRWREVTGKNAWALPRGILSLHSIELLGFCERSGYVTLNSKHPRKSKAQFTWYHPRTGGGSIKDLILSCPSTGHIMDTAAVQPQVATDHRMVVVRFNWNGVKQNYRESSERRRTRQAGVPGRGNRTETRSGREGPRTPRAGGTRQGSLAEKVGKLDLRTGLRDPTRRADYANRLAANLQSSGPSWESTQECMQRALLDSLPSRTTRNRDEKEFWHSGFADELKSSWSRVGDLQAVIDRLRESGRQDTDLFAQKVEQIKAARKGIRELSVRARKEYSTYWGQVWNAHPERRTECEKRLKTYGSGTTEHVEQIEPEKFADHFTKLFSKESSAANMQPRGRPRPTRWAIAGLPTKEEVQKTIDGLNARKASGSDGLPAEAFKLGGAALRDRMTDILTEIWPKEETWRSDEGGVPIRERTTCASEVEYQRCTATVTQDWQDAELFSIFKQKGSALDPGNYRGIFLLEVAGKILAGILNKRLQILSETYLSDFQCGFRPRRGAAQQILAIRRAQQALREVKKDACVLFIDFAKAFDSPPRGAIYDCLKHIGCPPDVLAMVEAIHERPSATVRGSEARFEMSRGIRQGCLLGPTLFIILLDVLLEQTGCRESLGVEFVCKSRGAFACPDDLRGTTFRVTDGEYADDIWMIAETPAALTLALEKLQSATGPLGLDVSVKKTEWLWLSQSEPHPWIAGDENGRVEHLSEVERADIVSLNGQICKRVRSFEYLGSIISEDGGCGQEISDRIAKSVIALGALNSVWENQEIARRAKIRLVISKVLPVLLYGCEAWDTTESDLAQLDVFLNKCRLRIAGVKRLRDDGSVLANTILHQMVRLPEVHLMIARRRLPFLAGVIGNGICQLTRRMVFAEVPAIVGSCRWTRIPARMRRDFRKVCETDLANLCLSLDDLVRDSQLGKKLDLRGPKTQMTRKRLVGERERLVECTRELCFFRCAEEKELTRHLKRAHGAPSENHSDIQEVTGPSTALLQEAPPSCRTGEEGEETLYTGEGPPFRCSIGGCLNEYKAKGGHLRRHITSVHKLGARFEGEQLWIRGLGTRLREVPELATGQEALDRPDGSRPLGGPNADGVRADMGRTLVSETDPGPESRDSGSDCTAEGEILTRFTDRTGKRLATHGLMSGGGELRKWSEAVVPVSCPFSGCNYPENGKARSWKTWLNHSASEHGWNLSTGQPSRKRAGKAEATGVEKASADRDTPAQTASSLHKAPVCSESQTVPNRTSRSLRLGAQTVVESTVTALRSTGQLARQAKRNAGQAELGVAPPRPRRGVKASATRGDFIT